MIRGQAQSVAAEWAAPRGVASMRFTAETAEQYGVSLTQSLSGTGVKPAQLNQGDFLVSGLQELQLVQNIYDQLGHLVGLGIAAGQRYHLTAYGALGLALASSANIRAALDAGHDFFQLTYALVGIEISDAGEKTRLHLSDAGLPKPLADFFVERAAAAIVTILRDLTGTQPKLAAVTFQQAKPADDSGFTQCFGVKPQFAASANRLLFERTDILEPLPMANATTFDSVSMHCRQLLQNRSERVRYGQLVQQHLMQQPEFLVSMDSLAQALYMSARTLRRRLALEGTTFCELRDQVRYALARDWLSSDSLSITEIGQRLGYQESASFTSAFRRWHGAVPREYRHSLHAQSHATH